MDIGEGENFQEKRTEKRRITDRFFSVEFTVGGLGSPYRCRIRDISSKGMCILVPGNSVILEHLKAGAVLEMIYHPNNHPGLVERLTTEIRHITADTEGPYKGQALIGLEIREGDSSFLTEAL